MAYVPDPTNTSQPDDTVIAETATAEFRALKAYIASLLAAGSLPTGIYAGGLAFKDNFLINGQFDIWQRQVTFALTATGYTADKWKLVFSGAARVTAARVAGPDGYSPFQWQSTVTTATGALGATDNYQLVQYCAGNKVSRMAFGTAQAKVLSLSFVAAFAVAGLHSIALQNGAQNRSYVATFQVQPGQVGVPSYYTIPNIPGDIAGTWTTDNSAGLLVSFPFAAGANFNTATPNQWVAGNALNTAGCVNEWGTIANVTKITRVRISDENGCAPYIAKSFLEELRDSRGYYEHSYDYGTFPLAIAAPGTVRGTYTYNGAAQSNTGTINIKLEPKRAAATMQLYSDVTGTAARVRDRNNGVDQSTNFSTSDIGMYQFRVFIGDAIATAGWDFSFHWTADADF